MGSKHGDPLKLRHAFCDVGGVRLHYVRAGQGPLVLLLHGFPECWYSWRHQIPALARNFTVVAPDLRGYNLSDKPRTGYDLDTLASDVTGLIRHLGFEKAHAVGHDWGGVIAFWLSIVGPERVERLVVMDAPHPARFREELLRNPRQLKMSWYMAFFQIPLLPEYLLTRNGAAAIEQIFLRSASNKKAFTKKDLQHFRRAALRPGAMRCAGLSVKRQTPSARTKERKFYRHPDQQMILLRHQADKWVLLVDRVLEVRGGGTEGSARIRKASMQVAQVSRAVREATPCLELFAILPPSRCTKKGRHK